MACDFFSVETAFCRTLYVLFFIEVGTRRIHITKATRNPDAAFATQQARNLFVEATDAVLPLGLLIRDRDAKFIRSFDAVFEAESGDAGAAPPKTS